MSRRQQSGRRLTADRSASLLKGFRKQDLTEPASQNLTDHAEPEPQAEVAPAPAQEPDLEKPVAHQDPRDDEFEIDEFGEGDGEDEDARPKRIRRPNRARRLADRPALLEYSRVDGRSLRRSDRLPLATRITPEAHDTVRRLANEYGYTIADLIEQGIEAIARKLDRRKKPS